MFSSPPPAEDEVDKLLRFLRKLIRRCLVNEPIRLNGLEELLEFLDKLGACWGMGCSKAVTEWDCADETDCSWTAELDVDANSIAIVEVVCVVWK